MRQHCSLSFFSPYPYSLSFRCTRLTSTPALLCLPFLLPGMPVPRRLTCSPPAGLCSDVVCTSRPGLATPVTVLIVVIIPHMLCIYFSSVFSHLRASSTGGGTRFMRAQWLSLHSYSTVEDRSPRIPHWINDKAGPHTQAFGLQT